MNTAKVIINFNKSIQMCQNVSKCVRMCKNVLKNRASHFDLRGDLLVNEVVNYLRSKYE